jgi:hypothetical protein
MADLTAGTPVREFSPDEIEQMLALHRVDLLTEFHQGRRANSSSADPDGARFLRPQCRAAGRILGASPATCGRNGLEYRCQQKGEHGELVFVDRNLT